jgi:hypothetical protein
MNYGPLRDSPNRVQRFVLESHWRSSMAIGLFGAGVGALLAAFRGIPLLVSALVNVPFFVLGSLGIFFFSSARHMTPSERQEMVVPYPSLGLPKARTRWQRAMMMAVLLGVSISIVIRLVQAFGGDTDTTDLGYLVVLLAVAAALVAGLRPASPDT